MFIKFIENHTQFLAGMVSVFAVLNYLVQWYISIKKMKSEKSFFGSSYEIEAKKAWKVGIITILIVVALAVWVSKS